MIERKYLTKKEVAERLGMPSTRGIDELVRRRVIPVCRFGYRTVRFLWPEVERALTKLTVHELK